MRGTVCTSDSRFKAFGVGVGVVCGAEHNIERLGTVTRGGCWREQQQRGKKTTKTSTTVVCKWVYIVLQLMNKQAYF